MHHLLALSVLHPTGHTSTCHYSETLVSWRIRAIRLCTTNARRSHSTITASRSNIRNRNHSCGFGSLNGGLAVTAPFCNRRQTLTASRGRDCSKGLVSWQLSIAVFCVCVCGGIDVARLPVFNTVASRSGALTVYCTGKFRKVELVMIDSQVEYISPSTELWLRFARRLYLLAALLLAV